MEYSSDESPPTSPARSISRGERRSTTDTVESMESTSNGSASNGSSTRSLRFEIPMGDDDLTVNDADAFHVVQDGDISEERCLEEFQQFQFKLSDKSLVALKEHFDAFFSLAKINSKIKNTELRLTAVKRLLQYFEIFFNTVFQTLAEVLQSEGQPPPHVTAKCALLSNYLLMTIYLLSRLSIHLENELMKRLLAAEKKKGVRKQDLDADMENWTKLRERIIDCFVRICELSVVDYTGKVRTGAIRFLWRPPDANKSMILALTETVFKFLENPSCTRANSLKWLETVFKLVKSMCIRFDYFHRMASALVEKTVNMEYMKETALSRYPFIQPIINVSVNDDLELLLSHMIHHLGDLIDQECTALTPKPYGLLMITMAELAPEVLIRQLSAIVAYLKKDVAPLRSAVLSAFSYLLCSPALTEANCQQYSRRHKVRNSMLNFLMDHLQDTNAMTRSRAVNIWSTLAENDRIPQEVLKRALISKIGERLEDKSVQVRKAAVHFLSKFLETNPYGHDFNYDLHKTKFYDLLAKYNALLKQDPEMVGLNEATTAYDEKEDEIKQYVSNYVQQHVDGSAAEVLLNGASVKDTMMAISTQVLNSPESCVQTLVYLVYNSHLDNVRPEEDFVRTVHSICECMRNLYMRYRVSERNSNEMVQLEEEEHLEDYRRELAKRKRDLSHLMDKMIVAREFAECLPLAMRAVLMGDMAEQKEGMGFVVKCKHFNVSGANQAVRMMCSLIWRNNQDIRQEVLKTAQQLFVSENSSPKIRVESTVGNLISVLEGMKEEERACLEEVICRMAVSGLPSGVTKQVWKTIDESDPGMKIVALQLYSILTMADKTLRKSLRSLQHLVKDKAMPPRVRSEALAAIAHMADESRRTKIMDNVFRLPATDSLFTTIENFVIEELYRPPTESPVWCDVFQNALTICFNMGKDTCAMVSRLVAKVLVHTHRVTSCAIFYSHRYHTEEENESMLPALKEQMHQYGKKHIYVTERCLMLCGEVALRTVIHVDVAYFREVKRLPEVIGMARRGEIEVATMGPLRYLKDWEVRSWSQKGMFDYSSKDDTNPHGTSDEERVRSRADLIMDGRLLRPDKLLSRIVPFVIYALRAEGSPPNIRHAATVAFCKLMLVSREFSERAAPLFFMLLHNVDSPVLRSNLIIAAGDLCFRMPNLVEKYATNVYLMTNDGDPIVRETAILVLTHLLTNQMLKHRGCLADVAKLYTDRVPEIRTLTGEFFQELGARGCIIYNLMPDFISRLSKNSREVSLQQFKTIMTFLMGLITKDKHLDSLVEKLCTRFEYAKTPQAIARNKEIQYYFSFCISQLPLSDKSFYKMRDSLSCYAEFLEDPAIYKDFQTCVSGLSKTSKSADVQADVDEFLEQMEKMNLRGLRADELNLVKKMNDKKVARTAAKRGARLPTREKKKKARFIDSEESEESD